MAERDREKQRDLMLREQLQARGIRDPRLLGAMRRIPRHLFVPEEKRSHAYEDHPIEIGEGQTISQPYMVAYMIQAAGLPPSPRVLEIGAGSGYAAAVLAAMHADVTSIEIRPSLVALAQQNLRHAGITGVCVLLGDGAFGFPSKAPYDAILVAAAAPRLPSALFEQLALGGRLLLPLGEDDHQTLQRFTKTPEGIVSDLAIPVRFVPMIGQVQRSDPDPKT